MRVSRDCGAVPDILMAKGSLDRGKPAAWVLILIVLFLLIIFLILIVIPSFSDARERLDNPPTEARPQAAGWPHRGCDFFETLPLN